MRLNRCYLGRRDSRGAPRGGVAQTGKSVCLINKRSVVRVHSPPPSVDCESASPSGGANSLGLLIHRRSREINRREEPFRHLNPLGT